MATKKELDKNTLIDLTNSNASEFDPKSLTHLEIKNYVRDFQIQKERQLHLEARMREEDTKINILNRNIEKLDAMNENLDNQAAEARKVTADLTSNIAELRIQLEKAQAESKISRAKQIKTDILVNAKILKDQEETIELLRSRRDQLRREQENQQAKLLDKRSQIERIRNEAVQSEFLNIDDDLVDLVQSTLEKRADKTQIMSLAIQEASLEMARIREMELENAAKNDENIALLKTQMLNLNGVDSPIIRKQLQDSGVLSQGSTVSGKTDNYQSQTSNVFRNKSSALAIEAEMKLNDQLDRLVRDGLISEQEKTKEIERFKMENAIPTRTQAVPTEAMSSKRLSKSKVRLIWSVVALLVLLIGAGIIIALYLLGII